MEKNKFVKDVDTQRFTTWLSGVIDGTVALSFKYGENPTCIYDRLEDAKLAYSWPPKTKTIDTPDKKIILEGKSCLARNQIVLTELKNGLDLCLNSKNSSDEQASLFGWVRAIMVWGGVYTKPAEGKGNAGWLEKIDREGRLADYFAKTLEVLRNAQTDDLSNKLKDFRSNAGTTKVHSLALPDFIIYDSRVAAALAWLVNKWAGEGALPDHLRFACMPPNEGKKKKDKKIRTPNKCVFESFTPSGAVKNHFMHATWNLRANWVLKLALDKAAEQCPDIPFKSLRDVEAALFMMGNDLKYALS